MKNSLLILIAILSNFIIISCQQEDVLDIPEGLEAPEIPPIELLTVPTQEIAHADSLIEDISRDTRTNWIHAGVSLLVWNSIVVVNLTTPVAALAHAFNQKAEYIGDNTFAWSYAYTSAPGLGGRTYDIYLTGQYISNEQVEWKLSASERGGFSNFEWITGIVNTDHTSAEFTLHRHPQNAEPYLQISTTRQYVNPQTIVRLTNVIPGHIDNGDYLEYGANLDSEFNRSFRLNTDVTDFLDIQWNAPREYGRVRHEKFFGDNFWHCWDDLKYDVDCN